MNPNFYSMPYAHISAVMHDNRCSYASLISLQNSQRKLITGSVNVLNTTACITYAELHAINETIDYLIQNGINAASIKMTDINTLSLLQGLKEIDNCTDIVSNIMNKIQNKEYQFKIEEINPESISYTMAERTIDIYHYIKDFKWSPEYDKYISQPMRSAIQLLYTSKTHNENDYINIALLFDHCYNGPKDNISLSDADERVIRLFTQNKEKQNMVRYFCLSGLLIKDACKCAHYLFSYDKPTLQDKLKTYIISCIEQRNKQSRSIKLNKSDIINAADRVIFGYPDNEYPLRSLDEAISDAFLEIITDRISNKYNKPKSKIYIISKTAHAQKPVCSVCQKEINMVRYICTDTDINNILKRHGFDNSYCSIECFAKAARLQSRL